MSHFETFIQAGRPTHAPDTELRELVKSLALFVENYRRMHSGTAYAPRVNAAAELVEGKLLELPIDDLPRRISRPEL